MNGAAKFYMSDRPGASMYNGGNWMPGMEANASNIHNNGAALANLTTFYGIEGVAGRYIRISFSSLSTDDFNSYEYVTISAYNGGYDYYYGYVQAINTSLNYIEVLLDDDLRPDDYSSFYVYGSSTSKNTSSIYVHSYVTEFRVNCNPIGPTIPRGCGCHIDLSGQDFWGYVSSVDGEEQEVLTIVVYGDTGLNLISYSIIELNIGGHWDGTEIHSTAFPDYSQILIEGHIKPYPQSSNGSVYGVADHLLYMAVDTNGEYSAFGATIDNENMATSNLFHTNTNNYGFAQPVFRGLVFKATLQQTYWYPFQFRDTQDIQIIECEFDLGEYQRAAICLDNQANDDEWAGKVSFYRCILNGGNGLVSWEGTGGPVILPRAEYSIKDCVINDTMSNALCWVTECHNNLVYNCRGHGIITARQCHTNVSVTNNTVFDCDQGIFTLPVDTPGSGQVGPIVIARNIVCKVLGRGIGVGRGYGPVALEDNIVWDYNRIGENYQAYGGLNQDDPMGDTTEESHQGYPVNLVLERNNRIVNPLLDLDYRPQIDGVCDLGNGRFIGYLAPAGCVDKMRERI